jgi:hypothetical protein
MQRSNGRKPGKNGTRNSKADFPFPGAESKKTIVLDSNRLSEQNRFQAPQQKEAYIPLYPIAPIPHR